MSRMIFGRIGMLALMSCVLLTAPVFAQDTAGEKRNALSREDAAAAVSKLRMMVGSWDFELEISHDTGRSWRVIPPTVATVSSIMDDKIIHEEFSGEFDSTRVTSNRANFAFDRLNKVYRVCIADDDEGFLDVYQGNIVDNTLVVEDVTSGTLWPAADGRNYGFQIAWGLEPGDVRSYGVKITVDDGATWYSYIRGTYTRRKD